MTPRQIILEMQPLTARLAGLASVLETETDSAPMYNELLISIMKSYDEVRRIMRADTAAHHVK